MRSAEGEKQAENLYHLSYYRKFVQIASFSLPHPSGAPSSEGAVNLQIPTVSPNLYDIGGAGTMSDVNNYLRRTGDGSRPLSCTVTVTVHDIYNFDTYREWNSFGNTMNNLAYTYHKLG